MGCNDPIMNVPLLKRLCDTNLDNDAVIQVTPVHL